MFRAPTCWLPSQLYKHANQTMFGALVTMWLFSLSWRVTLGASLQHKYAAKVGLTTKMGVGAVNCSVVGYRTSLYDPNVSIEEQETFRPLLVAASIKHLRNIGFSYGDAYDETRLDNCVKQLMDMAIATV